MRFKNMIKPFLVLAIIIFLCGCQGKDEPVEFRKTSDEHEGFGNAPCNLANGGYVCSDGSDIYAAKDIHAVYGYPIHSSEKAKLFLEDENGICNMNISGNTLYYISNPNHYLPDLYASRAYSSYIRDVDLRTRKTSTLLTANDGTYITNLYVVDEWAYYTVVYNATDYDSSYCKYFRLNLYDNNDVQELVTPERIRAMLSEYGIEYEIESDRGLNVHYLKNEFTIAQERIYFYVEMGEFSYKGYLMSMRLNGEDLKIVTDFECVYNTIIRSIYANNNSIFLEVAEGLDHKVMQWELSQFHHETDHIRTIPATLLHNNEMTQPQDGITVSSTAYYVSDEALYFFHTEDYDNQIFSVNQILLKDMEHSIKKLSVQRDTYREWSIYGSFTDGVHMVGDTLFWGFPPIIYDTSNQEIYSLFDGDGDNKDGQLQQQEAFLLNKTLRWDGFRMSDTFDYTFYENGIVYITSPVGAYPSTSFYEFENGQLTLSDENGDVYDVLIYDAGKNVFTSTMRQRMVSQAYMDDDGVLHDEEFEYGTLSFIQSDTETIEGTLEDIMNLKDIVACYQSCNNALFCIEVDYTQELPDSFDGVGVFYRVVSPFTTTQQVKENVQKYLTDELCETLWNESSFRQVDGNLYFRKGNMGHLSYDADKAILREIDENGNYLVAIPEYGSADNYLETVIFVFEKIDDGSFRLQKVV